ncbi:S8 family serine peptidase [Haloarchaeobius sp. DFWS5]|uniref:S8 family serine peptidase n=1 Tax=Haloarchaeobius sp. DFWS5 TaxID=3446114 RepID=UPI003EC031C8
MDDQYDADAVTEATASISSDLRGQAGTVEVVARLEDADTRPSMSRTATISALQRQAQDTQQSVLTWAKQHDGVTVKNRFWITNAVLLEVDKSKVDLDSLAKVRHVERLHTNFDVTLPESATATGSADSPSGQAYDTTYGIDQINATKVWDQYDTMGEGVKVAVLDTGVDIDHPDIDLYTEDSSDPTYPGGWAEFDGDGNIVEGSEPRDTDTHGTHTSGTVSGGNASGEYIGVAPNVDLMHGLVIPAGGGSFAQVAGGMEWAVSENADVVSMSLGANGYFTEMIDPVRNAEAAGTIVVASSGNSGAGNSGSPGNVYESFAIGASNEAAGIAGFSSGEEIDTSSAWGSAAPEEWPSTYISPDVAAPGVSVKSAVPGGGYSQYDGTSMAAPHVAGAIALMEAAAGGGDQLSNSQIRTAFRDTAWKPADEPDANDTRYGAGIIDVKNATDLVALDSGINGTVTDAQSGDAVSGASVSIDGGASTSTNAAGEYSVIAPEGTYDVSADAFGYEASSASVSVPNGSYATQDFSLSPALDVEVVDGQPSGIQAGDDVNVTVRVANLESLTVDLQGDYDAADASLLVAGEEATFGEPITFDEPVDGEVTVTVETTADTNGTISLAHTFSGMGESISAETGPTDVFEEFVRIGVVDDEEEFGSDVQAALDGSLSAEYQVDVLTSGEAMEQMGSYDAFVVQTLDESNAQAFVDATASPLTGVVYLDQWGSGSNGIDSRMAAIDDPGSTDENGFGTPPVVYEAADSHPILDGIAAPGEAVDIHTGSYGDHTWFSQSDTQTIATVGDQDGMAGDALSVSEERRTVLASSLGRTTFVTNGDYTDTADQILANSVVWAADSPEPAGVMEVTDATVQPDGTVNLRVKTDVDGVAGYQAHLTWDADKLQLTDVTGIDFADPASNIDNEEGWVDMAQAQANGVDDPVFAELEFNVTMGERGDDATVGWNIADSGVNYENGTEPLVDWDNGMVSVAACSAGDVNMDGEVTSADATLVQRYIVGDDIEVPFNANCADMNGDGQVTSADVTEILQIIVGNEDPRLVHAAATPLSIVN